MDPEPWTRLNRLLDEALDLRPEDQESWLASLGPDDEPLKARVRALLARQSSLRASGFLESIPSLSLSSVSGIESVDAAPDDDREGAVVGAYRLLRPLGAGGMGTVWLAERADGLMQRHVALKLPHGAWLRADLVARMGCERDPDFDHINSWIQALPRAVRWFSSIQ